MAAVQVWVVEAVVVVAVVMVQAYVVEVAAAAVVVGTLQPVRPADELPLKVP